jgi:hypothetical protein
MNKERKKEVRKKERKKEKERKEILIHTQFKREK